MRITITHDPTGERVLYFMDMGQVARHLKAYYNSYKDKEIATPRGRRIDFTRKSVARIAVKSVLAPILISILSDMYESIGMKIPEHVRHTDILDYFIESALSFTELIEKEAHIHVKTIESPDSTFRYVKNVSTTSQQKSISTGSSGGGGSTKEQEEG